MGQSEASSSQNPHETESHPSPNILEEPKSKIAQDIEDTNSIPQEFYDIRYGWIQSIVGAAEHYHPFIREFLAKEGGMIYGVQSAYLKPISFIVAF